MKSFIPTEAASLVQEHKNYRRYAVILACLAVVVALGTMLGLRMYGHAMTKEIRVFDCTVTPHQHTEACYVTVDGQKILNCGEADFLVHSHNYDCYNDDGELVCQLPEIKVHEHTDACWRVTTELICGQEETPAHTHDESCMGEVKELTCTEPEVEPHHHTDACYTPIQTLGCGLEEHTHTEACSTTTTTLTCPLEEHAHTDACQDEEGNIVCGMEEHTHTDDCYTTETALTCPLEEHTHTDACYVVENVLACGQAETDGHTHTDECYTVISEPVCGLEEGEGHTHTDACYAEERTLLCDEPEAVLHTHTDECWTPVEQLQAMTEDELAALDLTPGDLPALRTEPAEDGSGLLALTCDKPQVLEHVHTEDAGCFHTELVEIADEEPPTETDTADAGTDAEPICGLAEHAHTDECYDEAGELICGLEEHTHTAECYPAPEAAGTDAPDADAGTDAEPICGLAEHTHTDECYDETGELSCGLEEHTHTADCYPAPDADADAGTDGTTKDGKVLICGKEEHTHNVHCHTYEKMLVCGLEEGSGHTHDDTCYYVQEVLSCGKEEHTHTDECYADPGTLAPDPKDYAHKTWCDLADGSMRVTVLYNDDAAIPEEARLAASYVVDEERLAQRITEAAEALEDRNLTMDESYAPVVLTIGFYMPDGREYEPAAPVCVTVQMLNGDHMPDGKPITVVHFPKDGTAPDVMQGSSLEDGSIAFKTDGF